MISYRIKVTDRRPSRNPITSRYIGSVSDDGRPQTWNLRAEAEGMCDHMQQDAHRAGLAWTYEVVEL